ncbi:MAG: Nramp family divalent metal transporter [Anaerolineales bacterium]|nr:Nramp family divalent metal transporter [Anaerolineales bacterium]
MAISLTPGAESDALEAEDSLQIGVSRPALPLADLPTPEEVFKVSRFDFLTIIKYVLGPSMIALGVSIGSGEWLLGPLTFAKYGFLGIGWLITISAILQTFYNMEVGRFTMATGEVPTVAFMRLPPGKFIIVPLTLLIIYLGWIWGGWASTAGQSIFALFAGRPNAPEELQTVRFIGIGLMLLSFGLYMYGEKISQTLETFNTFAVWFILFFIIVVTIAIVPFDYWSNAMASAVIPAAVPSGMDASLLGAIIGYTGFGAGFNFMLINYYRDKGYGMGHRMGFISGLIGGEKKEVKSSGVTFRESPKNTALWNRWWRYLMMDQWGVFFIGALLGMFIPSILVAYLAQIPGAAEPARENMPIYAATELGRNFGGWMATLTLAVGAFTLFKTQATILEMLIRNTADAAYSLFPSLHEWTKGDMRKFYYPVAIAFVILIGIIIHIALPTQLLVISANMANFAAIIFPLAMIYLNRQLPKPARSPWWSTLVLVLNILFFGFFFLNFLFVQITGEPLVKF